MIIPEKIRLAGIDYDVDFVEGLNDGSSLAYGHIDYDYAKIQLNPNVTEQQGYCQTLLHEILHGISYYFGLEIEKDENTIDKLATGLYMVIKDNPKMFNLG